MIEFSATRSSDGKSGPRKSLAGRIVLTSSGSGRKDKPTSIRSGRKSSQETVSHDHSASDSPSRSPASVTSDSGDSLQRRISSIDFHASDGR